MIWIPVLYICLVTSQCAFLQGTPTYTQRECEEQLSKAVEALEEDVRVLAFDGTCVVAQAT